MAKAKVPAGCKAVSWDGKVYEASKKGIVTVPEEALPDLAAHGVVPVEEAPADDEPTAPPAE